MPNWCSTHFAIYPRRECPKATEQLHDFYQKLSNSDYDLYELGKEVYCIPPEELDKMHLRGSMEYVDLGSDEIGEFIRIDSEDAWSPRTDIFDYLLRTRYDLLTYCYLAEEPGCELYINTDTTKNHRFFEDRYVIDLNPPCDSPLEYECDHIYCSSAKEVVEAISDIYHRRFSSMKDIQRFIDSGYAEGLWVNEFAKA